MYQSFYFRQQKIIFIYNSSSTCTSWNKVHINCINRSQKRKQYSLTRLQVHIILEGEEQGALPGICQCKFRVQNPIYIRQSCIGNSDIIILHCSILRNSYHVISFFIQQFYIYKTLTQVQWVICPKQMILRFPQFFLFLLSEHLEILLLEVCIGLAVVLPHRLLILYKNLNHLSVIKCLGRNK